MRTGRIRAATLARVVLSFRNVRNAAWFASNRNSCRSVAEKKANSIDKHVGNQVRARRMTLGMSQGDLAKLLGLTFQQVQKYEKGANRIGAGRLFELARILGVGVLYFYEGLIEPLGGRPGFAEDAAPAPTPPAHAADATQL